MSITFNYMNFELGVLRFENDTFVYNSNPQEEQKAKMASFGFLDYDLYNSVNLLSKKPFIEFQPFLSQATREDIAKLCNITSKDSDIEKLIKMANKNIRLGAYSLSLK